MNKSKKIAITTVLILTLILVITGVLNKKGLEQRKEMLENAKITLKINGEEKAIATFEDIKSSGEKEFEAVLDTSNTEPHIYSYTGVQIKDLLSKYDIDLNGADAIIFTAVDGYTVAYNTDEVLEEGNVYLAYKREGELLETKENGGRGPYQTIVTKDQFSNRRCKWLTTIEVQNTSAKQEKGMTLKANGKEIIASFEDIKSAGEEEFKAVLDTSKTEPHTYSYTGVQVKNLLSKYDIDLNDANAVIFTADDGYTIAYSVDELLIEGNVYVTYARDGERFKTKENGGKGPYISIIVADQFSNRRCKYLTSIEVQN